MIPDVFRWLRWIWIGGGLVGVLAGETLTIATCNVENYTLTDRMTPDGFRPDYPKPEAAKTALRAVLRAIRADVVVLQEMGGSAYLEELRRDLAHEGLTYPHAEILEASDEPRHVAVLAMRPLGDVRRHKDLRYRLAGVDEPVKRGLLEITVTAGGRDVTLFLLHLKSRFTDRPDDPMSLEQRSGEAVAIRDRVLARFPDPGTARFVIAGDFNDGPTSRPVRAMLARGATPIARLVPVADSRGETWTHRYRAADSYTRVDHFMVSAGLYPAVPAAGARIVDGPGGREASDHRPVVLTLEFPPTP